MLSLGWDLGLGGIRTGKKAAMLHAELPGLNVPTDFALGLYAFVAPTDVDATRKNKNCKHDTMPDHRSSETTFTFLATEIADGQIPAGRSDSQVRSRMLSCFSLRMRQRLRSVQSC